MTAPLDGTAYDRKPIPATILIFGAADHIGGPAAEFLTRTAPAISLRLATRDEARAAELRSRFPQADVVIADYLDLRSLLPAVAGMEGIFVITPPGLDEKIAMENLVAAVRSADCLVQMIRIMGLHPDESLNRVPLARRQSGRGIEVQHVLARGVLDESGLPVTFLNCGATFMDNFIRLGLAETVRTRRQLIWPEHLVPWIDPRDVGEVAARMFLSANHRHIGQYHTMNNGHDMLRYREVAELMSELFGEAIAYDGSRQAYFDAYGHLGPRCDDIWEYMQYEQDNEVVWARNDFVERMLGRKPTTLREWLIEHREAVLCQS